MSGKHSSKHKKQVTQTVAGYKKRTGFPKQQTESWAFNGAGDPVFMGNQGNVSQFDSRGQVSPGAPYIPDEVAKMLVKEAGLRKSDTISKNVIEEYLESMRLSRGLAVDVARVLRDVYGVTPTFNESTLYARSGSLIEELTGVANGSFPMPFVDQGPGEQTDADIIASFIQSEFLESDDEGYDVALGALATLTPSEFMDVIDFYEWTGSDLFNKLEEMVISGPEGMAQMVVEGLCFPFRVQYMPEHVQSLFMEDAADDVISNFKKSRQQAKPVSFRKQAKADAKKKLPPDTMGKALADKAAANADANRGQPKGKGLGAVHTDPHLGSKLQALRSKSDASWKAAQDAAKAKHADEPLEYKAQQNKAIAKSSDAPETSGGSRMKRAGQAAIGAIKKAHEYATSPTAKKIGGAIKTVAGGVGKLAVGTLGVAAKAAGHVVGAAGRGLIRGAMGSSSAAKSKKKSSDEPGILGKIGHAAGRFIGGIKKGIADSTPGIQSQLPAGDDTVEKKKKGRVAPGVNEPATASESVMRSGSLLSEMSAAFSGEDFEDLDESYEMPSPADIVSQLEADTVVDMAVLEAIGDMDWDGVAKVAGFMLLKPDRFLSLIQSMKEGNSEFRFEWTNLVESGEKPSWMDVGSFVKLSNLSLDEGVIPRIVYWAGRAMQAAEQDLSTFVAESYPELGKTIYGPAGDPKEGPELAKSWMTPQPAGTMVPSGGETTRMFSDPDKRDAERKSRLATVMTALDGMRQQAAEAGVDPEGMFLNLYRDMHREKVRYS